MTVYIQEVEKAAMLFVPSGVEGGLHELIHCGLLQLRVSFFSAYCSRNQPASRAWPRDATDSFGCLKLHGQWHWGWIYSKSLYKMQINKLTNWFENSWEGSIILQSRSHWSCSILEMIFTRVLHPPLTARKFLSIQCDIFQNGFSISLRWKNLI